MKPALENDSLDMSWSPIPLDYFLNFKKPFRFRSIWIIALWIVVIAGSMWLTIINLPDNLTNVEGGNKELLQMFVFNPPMLIGLVMLFWLGFDWAFIPVFLSMFIIGIYSGLNFVWAILFGLSFVFGIAIYAITFQSIPHRYDLRSVSSVLFFVLAAFVASTASSLGAFIWSFSNNLSAQATENLWNGWWSGTFLQSLIIVGPILFIFSSRIEKLKQQKLELHERKKFSISWVYGSILVVAVVISIFVYSGQYLGKSQIAEEISRMGQVSEETILASINTFNTITWLSIWVILCIGAILLLTNWNRQLQEKVEEKTESLSAANDIVKASLSEKIILLKEIHHRVKNNLAVITAMIEMQYMRSNEENVRQVLSSAITRVKSIAFVHETLYGAENFSDVDLKSYINNLCDSVQSVFNTDDKEIELQVNTTGGFKLDMQKAMPLGLLINELLVNAYRHAFTGLKKGKITVDINADEDSLTLVVSDNGIGYAFEDQLKRDKRNLGITIINTLVRQLKATKDLKSESGLTEYRFVIQLSDNSIDLI